MDRLLKLCFIFCLLIITLSVAYYFVWFLPNKDRDAKKMMCREKAMSYIRDALATHCKKQYETIKNNFEKCVHSATFTLQNADLAYAGCRNTFGTFVYDPNCGMTEEESTRWIKFGNEVMSFCK